MRTDSNGNERWTITSLKDYADAKFQTLESAATSARTESEKAMSLAREATEKALSLTLSEHDRYLSKDDYASRHTILESKINDLQQTPWTTYAAMGMLFLAVIGGFWGLVNTRFSSLEANFGQNHADIQRLSDSHVTDKELNRLIDRAIERNDQQDKRLDKALTKAEFDAWNSERTKLIDIINMRIDKLYMILEQLSNRINGLHPPGNTK